jgi:hypothetical protein
VGAWLDRGEDRQATAGGHHGLLLADPEPERDQQGRGRAKEDNARAMQQDKQKRQDALCKTSKDAYMRAITSRRVYKPAADGTQNFLSDEEADAYRTQLRKTVQDNCGSVPSFDPEAPLPEPQPIPEPKVNPADATSR